MRNFAQYRIMDYKNYSTMFACDGIDHALSCNKLYFHSHKVCYAVNVATKVIGNCDGSCKGLKHERYGFPLDIH